MALSEAIPATANPDALIYGGRACLAKSATLSL